MYDTTKDKEFGMEKEEDIDNYAGWLDCCKVCPHRDIDFEKCYNGQSGSFCPEYKKV
jgi:hypothetical protein